MTPSRIKISQELLDDAVVMLDLSPEALERGRLYRQEHRTRNPDGCSTSTCGLCYPQPEVCRECGQGYLEDPCNE